MKFYSQKQSPWGAEKLDSSNYSLASQGCVVTCLAMLSNALNPSQVNELLKSKRGFSGPLVIWERAAALLGLPYSPERNIPKFYPCIAETMLSATQQHFFIMLGPNTNIDPLTGTQQPNRYKIKSYRNIGEHPNNTPTPPPAPVPPSGPAQWPRVINVIEEANVRSQPRLSAPLAGSKTLKAGDTFVGSELVEGDSVRGNNKWVRSSKGNYVHTINLKGY